MVPSLRWFPTLPLLLISLVPLLNGSPFQLFSHGQTTLYGPKDKVYLLNSTNIQDHIYNSDKAWFVEFFSSWCGHCINFAPKWKQFALDLYALEMEKEKGTYETLNRGIKVQKADTMEKLKRSLIDALESYFPKMLKFNEDDDPKTSSLWEPNDGFHFEKPKLVLVMFESEGSYVGKEVLLKLSITRQIKVHRFKRKNTLYEKLGLEGWPAVGYLKEDESMGAMPIPGDRNLVDYIYVSAYQYAGIEKPEEVKKIEEKMNPEARQTTHIPDPNRDVNSMDDILHALRDSLHKEIALFKVVDGEKLVVLRQYLGILIKLLPFDRRETKVFLEKLSEWVGDKTEIQSTEFLIKLEELEKEYHPWDIDLSTWDECAGTVPGRRGYTCGLWRMFHTLTFVGLQKEANEKVLETMFGFVKNFFGCRECSEHFQEMVLRDGILGTDSIKEQALWLWKRHNEVNLRLHGAPSEDPGYPKQLYPPKRICKECYKDDTDDFDEEKTLAYLINVYTQPKRSEKKISNHGDGIHSNHLRLEGFSSKQYHQPVVSHFGANGVSRLQPLPASYWQRHPHFPHAKAPIAHPRFPWNSQPLFLVK